MLLRNTYIEWMKISCLQSTMRMSSLWKYCHKIQLTFARALAASSSIFTKEYPSRRIRYYWLTQNQPLSSSFFSVRTLRKYGHLFKDVVRAQLRLTTSRAYLLEKIQRLEIKSNPVSNVPNYQNCLGGHKRPLLQDSANSRKWTMLKCNNSLKRSLKRSAPCQPGFKIRRVGAPLSPTALVCTHGSIWLSGKHRERITTPTCSYGNRTGTSGRSK